MCGRWLAMWRKGKGQGVRTPSQSSVPTGEKVINKICVTIGRLNSDLCKFLVPLNKTMMLLCKQQTSPVYT